MRAWAGYALAITGLVFLLLPGASAPSLWGALLMMVAGVAWGIYSLHGRKSEDSLTQTAGNFLLTLPMVAVMLLFSLNHLHGNMKGVILAIASGAFASGLGYALWYSVVRIMRRATAATVQLSVPVLAAVGGVLMMQEPATLHLFLTGTMILGGIALATAKQPIH